MSNQKIKTQWAAIRITAEQTVIVYSQLKDKPQILFYENFDAFCLALANKDIVVNKWAISISDKICIKKSIQLPAQSLDEAAQMLEFELPSLVPISTNEIVYGCTALKQSENVLEIDVYILRKDILEQQLEIYRVIGIHPEKVVTDAISMHAGFLDSDSVGSILLCIEKTKCHFLTTLNNSILDHNRLMNLDATRDIELLATELVQKENELKNHTDDLSIILISDDSEQVETLRQSLKNMGVHSPISLCPQNELLTRKTKTSFFDNLLTAGTFETIFDNRYKHLNLLPAVHLNLIKKKEKRKNAVFIAGLSILALLLLWANLSIWNWRTKRACQKVQELITPIEHIAADVEQKKLLVRALQGQTSDRQRITDIFYELYKYSPKSITISVMQYNQKAGERHLTLKGQTDSMPKAFDYSEALKKSTLLKKMQINNVQQIPTPGGSIVEFKAECLLRDK